MDSDSNEPTIPYGFGNQHAMVSPHLNDLNLPPHPFNVLATMEVIQPDKQNSPQSHQASNTSLISTPPMNLSTIEGWESPHIGTDDNTFCSEGEPWQVYWDISASETSDSNEPRHVSFTSILSCTLPPPPGQKRKLSMGISFPQKSGVSQHTCDACGQPLPVRKTP